MAATTLTKPLERKEREWIQRIANGESEAEQELLLFFDERIDRWVRNKIGKNAEDVEDLKQEIRIAIIKSLREGKFDQTQGKLGSYIYSIVRHKVADYLKSPKRSESMGFDIDIPDISDPQTEIEQQERLEALRKHLERLPRKYKEVLYLRYFLDRSISEISEIINLPPRQVSQRLNYAKKLLRNTFPVWFFFNI